MAFKANSIRLKQYSDSGGDPASYDGTAADGDIAYVGTALKLRHGGAWTSIAGPGGATQLSGLSDVGESPASSSINEVGVIVDDSGKKLKFQKLTIDNLDPSMVQLHSESFVDSDSVVMTAKAIDDRIDSKVLVNSNTTKHNAWNAAIEIASGANVNNAMFYNTTAQGSYAMTIPPVGNYAAMAQVQVINGSNEDMHITRKDTSDPNFNWQANSVPSVTQIDIGIGQRAIFIKTAASNWDVVVLSL